MNFKNSILVLAGEPNSIFLEIFFKSIRKTKNNNPLILIASHKLVTLQMKKLNFVKNIRILDQKNLKSYQLDNKSINLIDVKYSTSDAFEKISSKSNIYIKKCFDTAFKIIKISRILL